MESFDVTITYRVSPLNEKHCGECERRKGFDCTVFNQVLGGVISHSESYRLRCEKCIEAGHKALEER